MIRMLYRFSTVTVFLAIASVTACVPEEVEEVKIERGTVTDISGNTYNTVKIGEDWWMAENLRCTVYNDSTPIVYIEANAQQNQDWFNISEGAFTYSNNPSLGCLYNSMVLNSGKTVAPVGWHIPTDEEWRSLEKTLGMESIELDKTGWRGQREADLITSEYNVGWGSNNRDTELYGLDKFGFNALPSGCRAVDGRLNVQNNSAFWWTSSKSSQNWYYRYISIKEKRIFRQVIHPKYGLSIRCVKNK